MKTNPKMKMISNQIQNKNMKQLLLFFCFLGSFISSAQKQWTLQECITHALENNISVKQSQNNLLTNDQDIIAAKGNFLPALGANTSQRLNLGNVEVFDGNFVDRTFHSTNLSLNVSQTVFNGFRNTNIYKRALINKEANLEEYTTTINECGIEDWANAAKLRELERSGVTGLSDKASKLEKSGVEKKVTKLEKVK